MGGTGEVRRRSLLECKGRGRFSGREKKRNNLAKGKLMEGNKGGTNGELAQVVYSLKGDGSTMRGE